MTKLKTDETGFAEQILADLAFVPENLDESMMNHAALIAYYAEESRLASKKKDNFKLKIETTKAQLDEEIRTSAASKLTESAIDAAIVRSPSYVNVVQSYNAAKATDQMLRDVLEAFKQRSMMLVQFGSNRRAEFNATGMKINENSQESLKARREAAFS